MENKTEQNLRKIKTIDSGKKGPTVVIIGGIHGNESCGINAVSHLTKNLKLTSGKVYLIFGNPKGIVKNVRYIDVNLNRIFKDDNNLSQNEKDSYEYHRSQEIMTYLKQSDMLIDLHSTSIKDTEPFVIYNNDSLDLIKCLPISVCCTGLDSIEPGSTEYYMDKNGKNGISIECGFHEDEDASKFAINCVNIILSKFNMIDGILDYKVNNNQKIFKAVSMYKTKTNKFRLAKKFKNFEHTKAGQHIATDGNQKIFSDYDQYIIFANNCNQIDEEGFICISKLSK